jgi:FixJ family two-component response regulator
MMTTQATLRASGSRPQILLVEDDPAVRRSLQLLLHGYGFEARAYASGTAMLADSTCIQAVGLVADYRIPDIDGLEILSALRARHWNGPALLVTAHPSAHLARLAEQAGYSQILEKPLREHQLGDALKSLMPRAQMSPSQAISQG